MKVIKIGGGCLNGKKTIAAILDLLTVRGKGNIIGNAGRSQHLHIQYKKGITSKVKVKPNKEKERFNGKQA